MTTRLYTNAPIFTSDTRRWAGAMIVQDQRILYVGDPDTAERLAATLSAHLYGASRGAAILRVHDVAPHIDALKVWDAIADETKVIP